jgi:hypothetical protein
VSFDDGDHWEPIQLNLPKAWVTDLLVKDDDLIASTQGRAIWVLDDVTPLRQLTAPSTKDPARLFAPAVAWRVYPDDNRDTPLPPETPQGENPPAGVAIDYWLSPRTRGPVVLEIHDAGGALVRQFRSDEQPERIEADRYFTEEWLKPEAVLSAAPGAHRFFWNLRYPRPRATSYEYSIAAVFGEDTPTSVEGTFVVPGNYTVVLKASGVVLQAPLVVKLDPRVKTTQADLVSLLQFSRGLDDAMTRTAAAEAGRKTLHEKLAAVAQKLEKDPARGTLFKEVTALRDATANRKDEADLGAIGERLYSLKADVEGADLAPTAAQQQVFTDLSAALDKALAQWRDERAGALAQLNAHLRAAKREQIQLDERDAAGERQRD